MHKNRNGQARETRLRTYVVFVTIIFIVVISIIILIPSIFSGVDRWPALGAFGQLLEAYVVLVSAGLIYIELSRRREESVEHKIDMFNFLRSLFRGSEFSRSLDALVSHARAVGRGSQIRADYVAKQLPLEEVANCVSKVLSTFDILDRFICEGDLSIEDLVDYQGHRIWELEMALSSLGLSPGSHQDSSWGRRKARDLIKKVSRRWRERGNELGSGTFPHTWP